MHPRDQASRPGTTPWNTVLVRLRFASVKFIFSSVSRYMMLMLLPLSTMHLVNSTPSINGLMTMAYWFSVGTVWVVRPVPSYWNLRPAQVLGNWGESGHQDP